MADLKVGSSVLKEVYTQIEALKGSLETEFGKFTTARNNINANWEGEAATTHNTEWEKLGKALQAQISNLEGTVLVEMNKTISTWETKNDEIGTY